MEKARHEILVDRYITGKSYDELSEWIKEEKYEGNIHQLLKEVDSKHWEERKKESKKDLYYVIAVWISAFLFGISYFSEEKITHDAFFYISLFAWLPFFRSYMTVVQDDKKFKMEA